ncbi:ABC transporter ATP-binding protein/permease [Candidatus Pelagibacter sp.]|nr:ABC transporter ATP-binding protein/permease [Candidatus Pelagibacter sp.]
MLKNLLKVGKILILKSPRNFAIMVFLMLFQVLIISSSVLSIIPFADFIIDRELLNASIFTKKFISFLSIFNIKPSFFIFATFFASTQFLIAITTSLIGYVILAIKYDFVKKMNDETLQNLLSSEWLFFATSDYGYLTNTFVKETDKVGSTVGHIASSIALTFQLLIFILIPLYINFSVTIIVIIVFLIFALIILKVANPISQRFGKMNVETSNKLLGKFVEILNSIKTIKINAKESHFKKLYLDKFDDHVDATLKSQMLGQIINAFYRPSGIVIILAVFGFFISSGVILSELAAIFYSFLSIVGILNSVIGIQVNINNFLPAYQQLNEIKQKAQKYLEKFGNKKFSSLKNNLILNNIYFSYIKNENVLKNINLEINKNDTVAIVGKSGSGKTTIADLLCGILTPSKGEIIVDGSNLKEINISDYRKKIGYVSQDVHLFNDSIKNNLIWVCDNPNEINDETIINSLKLSNSLEFVEKMKNGIDTFIGEKGVQLSGGQRQRLSMARIFMKKPEILILDEATSALDNLSEIEIQESIKKLKTLYNITIIIIAHRLSTVKKADKIVILKNGMIQEQGTYEELKNKKNELFDAMTT